MSSQYRRFKKFLLSCIQDLSTNSDLEAIQLLTAFLDNLEKELKRDVELIDLVQDYPDLKNLLGEVLRVAEERFKLCRYHLNEKKPYLVLQEHGLTGVELRLKLGVVVIADKEIEQAWNEMQNSSGPPPGITSRVKNWIKRKLEVSDIIMGSLAEAGIPGAGALEEIKTVIEKIIKWREGKK